MFVPIPGTSARAYLARLLSSKKRVLTTVVRDGEVVDLEVPAPKGAPFGESAIVARYLGREPQVLSTACFFESDCGPMLRHRVRISGPSVAVIGARSKAGVETVSRVIVCASQTQLAEAVAASQAFSRAS